MEQQQHGQHQLQPRNAFSQSEAPTSDPEGGRAVQEVSIVVLGAQAVGKTSLVHQLVHCTCPESYQPTARPEVHHPSVTVNDRSYDTRLVDCPALRSFPENSLQEFANFRGYGLRMATAYVLVYDVADDTSFEYVRQLRHHLLAQGICAPILVVANKVDLLDGPRDAKETKSKSDICNLVRKQWRCHYAECSARYNWRVTSAFRELFKAIEQRESGHKAASARVQEAFRRNQCFLM